MRLLRFPLCLVVLFSLFAVPLAAQSFFPLEITQPPASGNHRAFWAAPGKPYTAPIAVIGGVWPYTFTLTTAPAGMTVKNASATETCGIAETGRTHTTCGEINWPNPPVGTVTVAYIVRDVAGATVSRSFTIQVNASPFRYVDAVNGRLASANGCTASCGDGSEGNPWRTLKDVNLASTTGQITYFRSGDYTTTDIQRFSVGAEGNGIDFTANRSTTWLAFPGHTPVIDHGGSGPMLQVWMWGPMVYVDGITHRNGGSKFYHILATSTGAVFRKNRFTGLTGDVSNAAFLMTPHNPVTAGLLIQDNIFEAAVGQLAIRLYDVTKTLIDGNVMSGISNCLDPKDQATRFTFRANTCANIVNSRWGALGLSGSFNNGSAGEVSRNLFYNVAEYALDLGATWTQPCATPTTSFSDNTIVGRIAVSRICAGAGPFPFVRNVIVNGDGGNTAKPYFTVPSGFSGPTWSLITTTNNLTAASGLVTATGQLTGTARTQWLGQRGYELGGGTGTPPTAACADGVDNDSDGLIDLADPGCASATDTDEVNAPPQPTCTFSIAPTSASVAAAASTGSVTVTRSDSSCLFSVSTTASWLTVSPPSGTSVGYAISGNSGAARSGTATIAGLTFTVSQAAPVGTPTGCADLGTTYPTGSVRRSVLSVTEFDARATALRAAGWDLIYLPGTSTTTHTVIATCR